jgi:nucleotide-binding universal stress UspA family protein
MSTKPNGTDPSGRIVVGVDGSKPSRAALSWAARQAALTAAPLTVLTTWAYPTNYGYPMAWPDDMDFAADAKSELDESIKGVLDSDSSIAVTTCVIEGHPALVLVEESKTAALIVVGSRGHGEFAGMLLGSVSEFVATHAYCPVVIIRDRDETIGTP